MSKLIDLTDRVVGRLTVRGRAPAHIDPQGNKVPRWRCECSCGKFVLVHGNNLRRGTTRSCGCIAAEQLRLMTLKRTQRNIATYVLPKSQLGSSRTLLADFDGDC